MSTSHPSCPMSRTEVIDRYFMEHRARLIDIAAFLDRIDRAAPDDRPDDFRLNAFRAALAVLDDGRSDRARRVLETLSDHSTAPIASAAGMKGAHGADPHGEGAGA